MVDVEKQCKLRRTHFFGVEKPLPLSLSASLPQAGAFQIRRLWFGAWAKGCTISMVWQMGNNRGNQEGGKYFFTVTGCALQQLQLHPFSLCREIYLGLLLPGRQSSDPGDGAVPPSPAAAPSAFSPPPVWPPTSPERGTAPRLTSTCQESLWISIIILLWLKLGMKIPAKTIWDSKLMENWWTSWLYRPVSCWTAGQPYFPAYCECKMGIVSRV